MLSVNGLLLQVDKLNEGKIVSKIQMAVTTTVDEIDLKKTCRICLIKYDADKLFCLFGFNKIFKDLSIASAVCDCFGIELKQDRELPNRVCIKCASSTLQSYTFKKCVKKCQAVLEERKAKFVDDAEETQATDGNVSVESNITCDCVPTKIPKRTRNVKKNRNITTESNTELALYIEKDSAVVPSSVIVHDHNYNKTEEPKGTTKDVDNDKDLNNTAASTSSGNTKDAISKNKEAPKWWSRSMGPPYTCQICGRKYGNKFRAFYSHVRSHQINNKIACTYCGKRFLRNKLLIHIRTHTNEKPFLCNECPQRFTIEANLKRHLRCHSGEKLYVCDICGKSFTQSTSLNSHRQRHIGQTLYVCVYCGKTFTSDDTHRAHLYKHKMEENNMNLDIKSEKSNEEERHECSCCNRVFKNSMGLQKHLKMHLPSKAYCCELCDNKFNTYKDYKIHTYWHDVKTNEFLEMPVRCKFCSKAFSDKNNLMDHVLTHLEKPYRCDYCDKSYNAKINLIYHLRRHNDERPFVCNVCGKTFKFHATLKQHFKLHTGEKPYKCDVCSKRFTQQQQLVSHMYTHTGEKKYKCPFCEKAFALNGNLTVHKRRHTGETPYVCNICQKGFYDSSTLKKHRQTHHKYISTNEDDIKSESSSVKSEMDT